jgi:hypothetical protein
LFFRLIFFLCTTYRHLNIFVAWRINEALGLAAKKKQKTPKPNLTYLRPLSRMQTLQTLDTGPARYSRQCVLSRKVMKDPVVQSVTKEIAERLKTELAISKPAEWYKLLTREHLANTQDGMCRGT